MREVTLTVARGVTVPRASSWIGTWPTSALATPTVVGGRRPRPALVPPAHCLSPKAASAAMAITTTMARMVRQMGCRRTLAGRMYAG